MDRKSFIVPPASGSESWGCGRGPSDSLRKSISLSPWSGRWRTKVDVLEVIFPKGESIFPIEDVRSKTPGGGQDMRTCTLVRHRPIQGESNIDFLRESEGPLPRLTSGCRWYDKRLSVHVGKLQKPPSRWTQSQTLLAERRFLPFSTEIHWRDQNYSYEFGCQAREAHRWLLEYWWLSSLVGPLERFHSIYSIGRKTSWRDICGPGGDWQENSLLPGQIICGQNSGIQWESTPSWRRSRSGLMKSSILKTHENCEGSIHWPGGQGVQRNHIKNARKNLKTSIALAMPCKLWRIVGVVHPTKLKQNLRVFWKLMNPKNCVWENLYRIIMKTILQEKGNNSVQHYNLVHKFIPMPHAIRIPAAKAAVDKEWEKLEKISAWNLTEVRSKRKWSIKQGRRAQTFILHHWWTYVI